MHVASLFLNCRHFHIAKFSYLNCNIPLISAHSLSYCFDGSFGSIWCSFCDFFLELEELALEYSIVHGRIDHADTQTHLLVTYLIYKIDTWHILAQYALTLDDM